MQNSARMSRNSVSKAQNIQILLEHTPDHLTLLHILICPNWPNHLFHGQVHIKPSRLLVFFNIEQLITINIPALIDCLCTQECTTVNNNNNNNNNNISVFYPYASGAHANAWNKQFKLNLTALRIPTGRRQNQLAIYKRDRGFELGTTVNKSC